MKYSKTFNPCDDCLHNFTKNNQESSVCKICEFAQLQEEINHQKAEIERLNSRKEVVVPSMRLIDGNPLNGFNLESHRFVARTVEDVKAEAYEEFAEEVNKELFGEEYQLDKAHRRAVERILDRLTSKE